MINSGQLFKAVGIFNSLVVAIMLLINGSAMAQMKIIRMGGDGEGEVFLLKELGAVIVESDEGLKVEMVLPAEQRSEKYKSVDLQVGDIIKMFNGKSMKSPGQIEEIYDKLAVDDEIKFGIVRGKGMQIIKFFKGDPDEMGGTMMIKKSLPAPDEAGLSTDLSDTDKPGRKMITMSPSACSDQAVITALLDAGLILDEKDGKVVVSQVIPELTEKFTDAVPKAGDIITKVQDQAIDSPKDLPSMYKAIKVGETVKLTFLQDGKESVAEFVKEAGSGGKTLMINK